MTKKEIEEEVQRMVDAYNKIWSRCSFLVGSSLVGNKQGDSARYWELQKELNNYK